ncbi:hypothetical protein J6590_020051, partial [Homalodisca vitripennis]
MRPPSGIQTIHDQDAASTAQAQTSQRLVMGKGPGLSQGLPAILLHAQAEGGDQQWRMS